MTLFQSEVAYETKQQKIIQLIWFHLKTKTKTKWITCAFISEHKSIGPKKKIKENRLPMSSIIFSALASIQFDMISQLDFYQKDLCQMNTCIVPTQFIFFLAQFKLKSHKEIIVIVQKDLENYWIVLLGRFYKNG